MATPLMAASGRFFFTSSRMSWKAWRTAIRLPTLRRTPPESDLWVMLGESIFMATGRPSSSAYTMASVAERATTVWAMGTRNAASSALDSISFSTLRFSASAVSITSRADSTEGGSRSWAREPGAWRKSFWF